jgi:hypothetical protein
MGKNLLCRINQLIQVMSEIQTKSAAESLQFNSSWVDDAEAQRVMRSIYNFKWTDLILTQVITNARDLELISSLNSSNLNVS